MTEIPEPTLPSQEITERYVTNLLNETKINERLHVIGKRINAAYKNAFKIDDSVNLLYSCYFKPGNKLLYKVADGKGFEAFLPEIDVSCIWSDTDLHIAINLLSSDFGEEFVKMRNAARAIEATKVPTLWEKIKSWF